MAKENKFIKLEDIDTSTAEENFSKLLNEKKTYFLNGSWGSGKTTFLGNIDKKYDKKLIFIDLWQINDSRPLLEIVFSKLHPVIYWGFLAFTIGLVSISILSTNVVNLGLEQYFGMIPKISMWVGIVALVVAVFQFFKFKTDIFYAWLFRHVPFGKKVLIIDDFDRLTEKQQEETYKIFSLLKGKLPIVFVGDISKIYTVKDNFLSKIIDRRVELPFILHPDAIWYDYYEKLESALNTEISDSFKRRIIAEKRNLRDREHFNDYINLEFFERGKLGHVQVEQQLLVIYVYLFYPEYYKDLVNDKTINKIQSISDDFTEYIRSGEPIENLLNDLQQKDSDVYPINFQKARNAYFLYEEATNRTKSEMEEILNGDIDVLKKELIESEELSDFYRYVQSEFSNLKTEIQQKLLKLVLDLSLKCHSNRIFDLIIQEFYNDGYPRYKRNKPYDNEDLDKIFEFWNPILEKENLDISEKFYILEKHYVFSFHELGQLFSELTLNPESFKSLNRKDFYLNTYLSILDLWNSYAEWSSDIWQAVDQMDDHEFISFWIFQGIISNGRDLNCFDYRPKDKKYVVWTKKYSFEFVNEIIDFTPVIAKLEPRLNLLESKGYYFEKMIDESNKRDY